MDIERCRECRCEPATVFSDQWNKPTKTGYCQACYERNVKKIYDPRKELEEAKYGTKRKGMD